MKALADSDVRILIAAVTFFALLLVLLAPDDFLSCGLMDSGWFPSP
jgi:hypothetical protein